jgi:predicted nucleic acid-binding protein
MRGLTLDTGALVALEHRSRRALALVEAARRAGVTITVPAHVVAEWWRGQRGPRRRLLESFEVEPFEADLARVARAALARIGISAPRPGRMADALVMASAASRGDVVLTAHGKDLGALGAIFPMVRVIRL